MTQLARISILFFSLNIFGYILPGGALLDKLVKNSPKLSQESIKLNNIIQVVHPGNNTRQFFSQIFITSGGLEFKNITPVLEQNTQKLIMSPIGILEKIFTCSKNTESCKEIILEYLKTHEVKIEQVGLSIYMGRPAFVLGFDANNSQAPTLWLEHDSFLPIKEKYQNYEIKYEHWAQVIDTKLLFPLRIIQKNSQIITNISTAHAQETKTKILEY